MLLHTAAGALIAGLGGGSALGGAAGAAVSSASAGKLNSIADAIGGETGSMLAGNIVSNVLAGAGGALVGGSSGAFAAANADLYNAETGNAKSQGDTGSQLLDWLGGQFASAGRGAVNFANQFVGVMNANSGQTAPADPNPLVDVNNGGHPPATGGAVVTPPAYAMTPEGPVPVAPGVAVPGTPGYVPDTATLSESGGDEQSGSGGSGGVTSDGTANSATLSGLKGQLASENLANIAAQDPRLAEAVSGSGTSNPNFSIGTGTVAEANALGQAWVGEGATLVSNQVSCPGCLVSADGTMIYRPPQPKSSQFSTTGVQANFVRQTPNGTVISNGHLNVTP